MILPILLAATLGQASFGAGYLDQERQAGQDIPIDALSLSFSPDGERLFVIARDGSGSFWDVKTRARTGFIPDGINWYWPAVFSPDGQRIATSAVAPDVVILRDAGTGEALKTLEKGGYPAFSKDGSRILTLTLENVFVYETETGKPVRKLNVKANAATFGEDASTVLTIDEKGAVKSWNLSSPLPFGLSRKLTEIGAKEKWGAFSSDGSKVLVKDFYATLGEVWDWKAHRQFYIPFIEAVQANRRINSGWFSGDGSRVLSVFNDFIGVVPLAKPNTFLAQVNAGGTVNAAAISMDGTQLAFAVEGKGVWIWREDPSTGAWGPVIAPQTVMELQRAVSEPAAETARENLETAEKRFKLQDDWGLKLLFGAQP